MYLSLLLSAALCIGIALGRGEKLKISFGDICGWAFLTGLFSGSWYGFFLSVVIAIGAILRFRYESKKKDKEDAEWLRVREIERSAFMELNKGRSLLRDRRKAIAELNKAKKDRNRLPKSSNKYFKKLEEKKMLSQEVYDF